LSDDGVRISILGIKSSRKNIHLFTTYWHGHSNGQHKQAEFYFCLKYLSQWEYSSRFMFTLCSVPHKFLKRISQRRYKFKLQTIKLHATDKSDKSFSPWHQKFEMGFVMISTKLE
jgi:hypothetical protein